MHKVSIKPQWTISDAGGQNLTPRLLELLAEVQSHGSLSGSCKKTGASYRHAWSLIRQGFMVAKGNPHKIYEVSDLTRKGLRFVNRQPSSGTRFLLECFLKKAHVSPAQISGYEQAEFTHAAVAAYVASGMADVGFGVETPARRFKLEFLPLATERYFLLCNQGDLEKPHLKAVLKILNSDEFQFAVNQLPGYTAAHCGQVSTIADAFPELAVSKKY